MASMVLLQYVRGQLNPARFSQLMPLAVAAKKAGCIGIQLGGQLQLLFGIYGQRYLQQEWHAKSINESWVRPIPQEVAKSSKRVEDGCYW
jgi:hypothetical protein